MGCSVIRLVAVTDCWLMRAAAGRRAARGEPACVGNMTWSEMSFKSNCAKGNFRERIHGAKTKVVMCKICVPLNKLFDQTTVAAIANQSKLWPNAAGQC